MQEQIIKAIRIEMSWWELYQKADKIQAKILKKAKIIQSESEFIDTGARWGMYND